MIVTKYSSLWKKYQLLFCRQAICFGLIICLLALAACQSAPTPTTNSNTTPQKSTNPSLSSAVNQAAFYHQKAVTWQIEQTWGMWPNTNWNAVEQDAADLENAHITWARTNLDQGIPFGFFDHVLQIANQHGIHLLALVSKNDPAKDIGTQKQRDAYKAWLGSVVARYKGSVQYWEIQNETNSSDGWSIDNDPGSGQGQFDTAVTHFVADMQDSYTTIHAKDSNAKVVFGGVSQYNAARYLDGMIKNNAYRYMDIMAFHPYGSNPGQDLNRLKVLKAKMASQPGFASKPIWVTEVGYHTMKDWTNNAGYVPDEDMKAMYLVQTIEALDANGVQLVFWYTLHEDDGTNGYGLTRRSAQNLNTIYLPAYTAYKNLWSN